MISWLNAQINDAQLRRSAQSDLEKFAFWVFVVFSSSFIASVNSKCLLFCFMYYRVKALRVLPFRPDLFLMLFFSKCKTKNSS
jgi:hypothetical protein